MMKKNRIEFLKIGEHPVKSHLYLTVILYILWIFEFAHAGGIPFVKIILNQPYNYRLFGIPSLHVLVATFSSFYTIFLFHIYLSQKSKAILTLYLINFLAGLLIYNRGMMLLNLCACVFLFLIYASTFTLRHFAIAIPCACFLLFFFGVLGNLRVSREAHTNYTNEHFLQIGEASDAFKNSIVPKEYFWSYIYISSPLANLQHNINSYPAPGLSGQGLLHLFNNEILMDFLSKRINARLAITPPVENRIPGPFNATTIYSRAFCYMGWPALIIMFVVMLVIPYCYLKAVPQTSPFFLTGFATLCTMYLFFAFENMLRFTGLSFQLVYPLLFASVGPKIPLFIFRRR